MSVNLQYRRNHCRPNYIVYTSNNLTFSPPQIFSMVVESMEVELVETGPFLLISPLVGWISGMKLNSHTLRFPSEFVIVSRCFCFLPFCDQLVGAPLPRGLDGGWQQRKHQCEQSLWSQRIEM